MSGALSKSEIAVALNLAHRIVGSEADANETVRRALVEVQGEANGDGPSAQRLFAATRNASHELMSGRQRPLPPETASSEQEAVANASMRLPIRQREALALRELGQLSYEEVAAVMETSSRAVAQLISRARINLSDELHGTVLAAIAAPSPDCERALPLIAMRDDGQLEAGSDEAAWLDRHLNGCERCQLGIEAMREAEESYRALRPLAPPATLAGTSAPRRRLLLVAGAVALTLLLGAAAVFAGGGSSPMPAESAADGGSRSDADPQRVGRADGSRGAAAGQGSNPATKASGGSTEAAAPTSAAAGSPSEAATAAGGSGGSTPRPAGPGDEAALEPTQRTSAPKGGSKPKPQSAATAAPAPPPPAPEEPAPVEETPPGRHKEPPGKAVGRPPK